MNIHSPFFLFPRLFVTFWLLCLSYPRGPRPPLQVSSNLKFCAESHLTISRCHIGATRRLMALTQNEACGSGWRLDGALHNTDEWHCRPECHHPRLLLLTVVTWIWIWISILSLPHLHCARVNLEIQEPVLVSPRCYTMVIPYLVQFMKSA